MAVVTEPQSKSCPPHPLDDNRVSLEKSCGVRSIVDYQRKLNSEFHRRGFHIDIDNVVLDHNGDNTLEYWPARYFDNTMLFTTMTAIPRLKFLADFYHLQRVFIYRIENHLNDSKFLLFPLSRSQGADQNNMAFNINPLKNEFKIRRLIIKMNSSCEFLQDRINIAPNKFLQVENVFKETNNLITAEVRKEYSIIVDKTFSINCKGCDSEETLCFVWDIFKDTCITNVSGQQGAPDRNVRILDGYYWYIEVNNLYEPYRFMRQFFYGPGMNADENQRYLIGPTFNPFQSTIGPPGISLENRFYFRYSNKDGGNPMAVAEFKALKDQLKDLTKTIKGSDYKEEDEDVIISYDLNSKHVDLPKCDRGHLCKAPSCKSDCTECENVCGHNDNINGKRPFSDGFDDQDDPKRLKGNK